MKHAQKSFLALSFAITLVSTSFAWAQEGEAEGNMSLPAATDTATDVAAPVAQPSTSPVATSKPENAEMPRAHARNKMQKARIRAGVKSGKIDKKELKKLKHSQRAMRRAAHHMAADGKITPKEKARMEKMQNRRSKQIHRMKN